MARSTLTLDGVRTLAREAHAGQVDKQGRDYFVAHLDPIAASLRKFGDHAEMAGYLHDIIEDTEMDEFTLLRAGVPFSVVRAVAAVSKREGEPYEQLIRRAALDPLGRLVKLADNAHNLAELDALAETDPETAERLHKKYTTAREILLSVGSPEGRAWMISALQEMEHNHPRATPDPDHWPSRDDLDEMESLAAFRDQIVALEAYDV
ncbi:phosphohydrolase [Nocardioides sp. Y6]|uniref:Phosphohydrolase n=1 Tax=Nocardioides malaquae TaxID=2773426 RepID=A0ABR9RP00_9ACTN|nr:phosphohydrolase [Nocardioides malaquae]MBE7323120.1 phosphohydrolase [Nocardioides malaquae]